MDMVMLFCLGAVPFGTKILFHSLCIVFELVLALLHFAMFSVSIPMSAHFGINLFFT
jgi:hypothetical protein